MNKLKVSAIALAAAVGLAACGGGSSSNNGGSASPSEGEFTGSTIIGVAYKTATQEGFTGDVCENTKGCYNFLPNEKVTFTIGGVEFPEVDAAAEVTTLQVVNAARVALGGQALSSAADLANDPIGQAIYTLLATFDQDEEAGVFRLPAVASVTPVKIVEVLADKNPNEVVNDDIFEDDSFKAATSEYAKTAEVDDPNDAESGNKFADNANAVDESDSVKLAAIAKSIEGTFIERGVEGDLDSLKSRTTIEPLGSDNKGVMIVDEYDCEPNLVVADISNLNANVFFGDGSCVERVLLSYEVRFNDEGQEVLRVTDSTATEDYLLMRNVTDGVVNSYEVTGTVGDIETNKFDRIEQLKASDLAGTWTASFEPICLFAEGDENNGATIGSSAELSCNEAPSDFSNSSSDQFTFMSNLNFEADEGDGIGKGTFDVDANIVTLLFTSFEEDGQNVMPAGFTFEDTCQFSSKNADKLYFACRIFSPIEDEISTTTATAPFPECNGKTGPFVRVEEDEDDMGNTFDRREVIECVDGRPYVREMVELTPLPEAA